MPKSKRAKVVHLSKLDKKGKELSQKIYANVQEAASSFPYIFVLAVHNMRNNYLKDVRSEFSDSRYLVTRALRPRLPSTNSS
jgi:mRNA turnover protein 4